MLSHLRTIWFNTLFICVVCLSGCAALHDKEIITPAKGLPDTTPWDLKALSIAPHFEWAEKDNQAWSLYYQGPDYKGKHTRVFAYYSNPAILNGQSPENERFPAIVLVHGGGGTAFKEWAVLWAQRGYAAIAMDLAGCGPREKGRLEDGGPSQTDASKFDTIDGPISDIWSYQAVANVILAHSLIRSFAQVDPDRTAITGISWGGYLTCIAAGLDNRFKAAVPVYGCGFLHENSFWMDADHGLIRLSPQNRDKWVRLFDPSMYVGSASMPIFFVNGTNDFAYPLDSYQKTYQLVKSPLNLRITVNMPHNHADGWAPKEIGAFVDQHLKNGPELPAVKNLQVSHETVIVKVKTKTALSAAALHYTAGTERFQERRWKTVPAHVEAGKVIAPAPPQDATAWFVTVTDECGMIVSSKLVFPSLETP